MTNTLDKIAQKALEYKDDIANFLFELANINSESRNEKPIIQRIKIEMQKIGFDKIQKHEKELIKSLIKGLKEIPSIQFF